MPVELPKHFEPSEIDLKWNRRWESGGVFSSEVREGREPYSIVLPPPNVTGTLHMGHAFQHTLMDALIRKARMEGKNTLWQPGIDHAGIATQIVVTRELEREGIDPASLSREEFMRRIWKWKENSGSTISIQMRRLGASCAWNRERFTMDEGLSRTVTEVFVKLYRDGLIYRGKRLVNWDPELLTAVSDLEVVAEEEDATLYHVRYPFADGDGHVVIATTRPETILADGAIAVHPDDERNRHLVGRTVFVPLCNREIQVIADGFVDPDFGSGRVKITAAHDFNDYECSRRHPEIPVIVLMTLDGRMNENALPKYQGKDRFEARRLIIEDLEKEGLLERQEPHRHSPPRGDRSGVVLEPMLTDQWFVSTRALTDAALNLTRSGRLRFVPERWRNVYEQWLENIDDWCISRQLIWGHRIPAWHGKDGEIFVAHSEEEACELAGNRSLVRDPDVLDTWFSSALWPFSTLGWPDVEDPHFKTYFPTSVLVTGFDIIFFWVARMTMMSCHFLDETPFREVYVTGLVRDARGEKMSKSKGNTLDPLDLIDGISLDGLVEKRVHGLMNSKQASSIERKTREEYPEGIPAFGVDALRMTFASYASYGRDIKFDMGRCLGYRNFCNKLWNASRFVLSEATRSGGLEGVCDPTLADRWIASRLQRAESEIVNAFAVYRFDTVVQEIYHLVWDEYCGWYLEMAKLQIRQGTEPQARSARLTLIAVLEAILRLAHPLMPYITEELWGKVVPLRATGGTPDTIMGARYPEPDPGMIDEEAESWMVSLKELVEGCRRICSERDISRHSRFEVAVQGGEEDIGRYEPWFSGLTHVASVLHKEWDDEVLPRFNAAGMQVTVRIESDPAEDLQRLRKSLAQMEKEMDAVKNKLGNPKFVERAPQEIVAAQKAKREELEGDMAMTRERIAALEAH